MLGPPVELMEALAEVPVGGVEEAHGTSRQVKVGGGGRIGGNGASRLTGLLKTHSAAAPAGYADELF
jgi:hypothetical protein